MYAVAAVWSSKGDLDSGESHVDILTSALDAFNLCSTLPLSPRSPPPSLFQLPPLAYLVSSGAELGQPSLVMAFSDGSTVGHASDTFLHHSFQYENDILCDVSLRQVVEVANEDVEMQDPPSQILMYLIVDTNIMLHYLDVLQQFVVGVERLALPVRIIVPGIVISELDKQKSRPSLGWLARQASDWLLREVRKRATVKAQAHEETCKRAGRWNVREPGETIEDPSETNDNLILDCSGISNCALNAKA
ncbi:hypothetical protein OF83DRAFT_734260 [Amylostereum chailletii]|nr:hypothetical protein OF83DRAFT_734260 [Amylostereum chailletii]